MKATDKDYLEQQQALLPVGYAWNREPDGIVNRILAGLALVWARVHGRALALVDEADPQTATETLEDWEENLGLPDECTAGTANTLQERRAAVLDKLTAKGFQSVAAFYRLAEALGYNVTITEHRPFICGIGRCGGSGDVLNGWYDVRFICGVSRCGTSGDAVSNPHEVRFVWTVTPKDPRLTRFRCGVSAPPERLCKFVKAADLECRLRKNGPAHTLPVLNYEETAP